DTLSDGAEELTHLTNPLVKDTDSDGLNDNIELGGNNHTNPNDSDSDDDCIVDGNEDYDHDGNFDGGVGGELNPNADGDGIPDGSATPGLSGEGPCSGAPYPTGQHVSDPTKVDTDGDGFTDYEELATIGTNPRNPDSDNDGLTDYEEAGPGGTGTNPNDSDSDDDGLSDGVEVDTTHTNPLVGDSDGDGIGDAVEGASTCALDANNPDTDGDGLCDGPGGAASAAGLCSLGGSGLDADNKGEDKDADCVRDAGETNPLAADSDADGRPDGIEYGGVIAADGQPPDSDGDGIIDDEDQCPDVAGTAELKGCSDKDGDGVLDHEDRCPEKKGKAQWKGCGDMDGDEVPDPDDLCPKVQGPKDRKGCPPPPKEIQEKFSGSIEGIFFETGSAELKAESNKILDEAAEVMNKFGDLKLEIDGHTDDVGKDDANLKLSQDRADAVKQALTERGVKADRMKATGFGETKPAMKGTSKKARAKNRRIEFKIVQPD
ncbi:MAG: OmpA family protein, partial [Myxococcales bacterium]|nr:OmpA family protein [Myxococcales bacterium]